LLNGFLFLNSTFINLIEDMENSEIKKNGITEESELVLSKASIGYLTETRKWTMFFSILGFIAIAFMILGAIIIGIIGLFGGAFGGMNEAWIMGVIAFVYLGFGLLYFFPVLYLLKFSINMRKAVELSDQNNLLKAFENLKSHYRFLGILMIVLFGIYILIGLIAGAVALSAIF